MKAGDNVRFVHTKGGGIIRKVIDDKSVQVEIEDGFLLPFSKTEVVVVAADEKLIRSGGAKESNSAPVEIEKSNGVHLAFTPFNDKIYSLILINDTNNKILYTFHEKTSEQYSGIISGQIDRGNTEKLKEYNINEFENWPEFIFQILKFQTKNPGEITPLYKAIRFKAATFYKSKKTAPVINQTAFVYQLDNDTKQVSRAALEEQLSMGTPASIVNIEAPANEVDLHMEILVPGYGNMSTSEILKYQFDFYEKQLENAVASNMEQIIFIHGTGNGILKNLIHRNLTSRKDIKFFQDARKEKFGFGATLVKIR